MDKRRTRHDNLRDAWAFLVVVEFVVIFCVKSYTGLWTLSFMAGGLAFLAVLGAALTKIPEATTLSGKTGKRVYWGIDDFFYVDGVKYRNFKVCGERKVGSFKEGDIISVRTRDFTPRVGQIIVMKSDPSCYSVREIKEISGEDIMTDLDEKITIDKIIGVCG